jgi:hypothetical protein
MEVPKIGQLVNSEFFCTKEKRYIDKRVPKPALHPKVSSTLHLISSFPSKMFIFSQTPRLILKQKAEVSHSPMPMRNEKISRD